MADVATETKAQGNGEGWILTQETLDEAPVRNFLNMYASEKKKFPPLDFPGGKKKKLAICGLATTTRMTAPFQDQSFDIWACHQGYKILPRVDVAFEVHDPYGFAKTEEAFEKAYWDELKTLKIPVFMDGKAPSFREIPSAIAYPIDEIVDQFGRFQTNTIEYMVWLGIRQGYEQIGLFGVEMEHQTEYNEQARGVIYSIGIAMGRGIGVYLPPECQLFKCKWLYGFETVQRDIDVQRVEQFKGQMQREYVEKQNASNAAMAEMCRAQGRVEACDVIQRRLLKVD